MNRLAVHDIKVSFLLFSYNHGRFLAEACQSIIRQTRSPDEVILCDDGSTDGSREVLQKFADQFSPQISTRLLLSERNQGLAATINQAFAIATGELWVLQAGDDLSREDRVEKALGAYELSGRRARSVSSNAEVIDAQGRKEGIYFPANYRESYRLEVMAGGNNGVLGATQSLHREVWDVFGPMPHDAYQEDVVLPFRAAMLGTIVYLDEPLVSYRHHNANLHFTGQKPSEAKGAAISREKLERKLRNNVAIARGHMPDIDVASRIGRLDQVQAKRLRRICERTLRDAEIEYTIGLADRWRIPWLVISAFWQGVRFRRCVRMALCYLSPSLHAMVLNAWGWCDQMLKRGTRGNNAI